MSRPHHAVHRFALCLLVCGLSLILSAPAFTQPQLKKPDPFAKPVAHRILQVEIPPLNRVAVAIEDEADAIAGLPPRYAVPHPVVMTPHDSGTWEALDGNLRRWTLEVSSPEARSINLGFTRYFMPDGGQLAMRSADGQQSVRPFTADDNAEHGELWTPPINSDHVVIEVTLPADQVPALDLTLGSINVGYRGFGALEEDADPRSGSCNVDVACSIADPWRLEVKSVGVISTGGSRFCTGFMVNNTAQDLTPYFMTANHCGVNSGNAASLVVFWNYENTFCRGVPGGSGVGNGSLSQSQTGSTWRASASVSDFTLVQLSTMPNPLWEVSYAGWDRQGLNPPSGVCIHHPSTNEKRITFYDIAVRPDRPTHGSSWPCSSFPGPGDNTHIRAYWSLGVTEPGSSGSPLFDENHRVIGQLHGGPAACGLTGDSLSDCYGRFSRSWTGNGTNSSRLSNWLDAINTGELFIDTISSAGMTVTPTGSTLHIGEEGGPFTNPSVVYSLSNPTPTPIDYSVSLTANFGILLNGGTTPVAGTLAASGGTTNVTVSLGSAIDALSAGIYTETVVFNDITNSRSVDRVHTVEVGQTGFTTEPANDLVAGGPVGGPFNATQVYTLTSTRPTPVDIQISANQPWISINGGTSTVNLTLTGTGDSANVTIGYSSAADSLSAGIHTGTVTISNESGGAGTTTRQVTLDVGRYTYTATDVPQPINDHTTITSTINVTDNYCIADVDVELHITHTWIGDLTVDLTSPQGTIVRLHNRTGGSTDDIHTIYDDGVNNPDGPGMLADFNFSQVQGVWTLTVRDNATADVGSLDSWTLRIAALPTTNCPERVLVHDFPLDTNPGWSTQGQWAFGVPQPTGGNPSSGFTGPNVYGYNLAGQYPNNMSSTLYLTTTALDCSDLTNCQLRFRRWLGVESSIYDKANIQISNNGTTWTTVWEHSGPTITESSWSAQSYNISAAADGKSTVYIRWGMGPTDSSVTFCGWNIDDIQIWAVVPNPCENVMPADVNLDQTVDAMDIQAFTATLLNPGSATPQELCAADLTGDSQIGMADVDLFVEALLTSP